MREPQPADDLAWAVGLGVAQMSRALTMLELQGRMRGVGACVVCMGEAGARGSSGAA